MCQKILVPVDLSDTHQQAIEIAANLAGESDGQVILLHVVEVIPGLWVEEDRDFYDRIETAARDHLAQLADDSTTCMCRDAKRSFLAIVLRKLSAMPRKGGLI